jgi:glycosyltransferase involved in cell wall biosynthesis
MKLSIITINYNNKDGLCKTLTSIAEQKNKSFEYIVIDGGSTDGSVDIITEYAKNINYWISEKDHGIYNAMNKGICKATGDYILFINSGDHLFSSSTIDEILKCKLVEDLIVGDLYIDYIKKKTSYLYSLKNKKISKSFLLRQTLPHPSTLVRKQLLINLNMFDEAYKIAGDYDFFVRAVLSNATCQHIPVAITVFNDMGVSYNNLDLVEKENKKIRKKYYNLVYRFVFRMTFIFQKVVNKVKKILS